MPNVYRLTGDGDVLLVGGEPDFTGSSMLYANGPTYPEDPPTPWDLLPEEEKQPVHPWTLAWWRLLPACHRYLDPLQGSRESESWHGLNADPRWILSWDGWETYNRSSSPERATVEFRRIFRSAPGRPIYVQTWGNPQGHTIDVTIRVADSSGIQFGGVEQQIAGTELQMVGALVDRPRNGILVVSVLVDLDVFSERLGLEAIHVGDRFVSDFDELPNYADKKTPAAYPLLRWLDGPGRVAGEISDIVANLIDGVYTDPRRAPEEALRWLAMMLGIPAAQIPTDPALLREHLIHFVDSGRPKTGSRAAIEEVAARWLTGTRSSVVIPQRLYGKVLAPEEEALLDAAGATGAIHLEPEAPTNPDAGDVWVDTDTAGPDVYTRSTGEVPDWVLSTDPAVTAAAADILANTDRIARRKAHTLILLARPDEVPGGDLESFAQFVKSQDVVPAGHDLIARNPVVAWDVHEAAVGPTWDHAEEFETWNEQESAGLLEN